MSIIRVAIIADRATTNWEEDVAEMFEAIKFRLPTAELAVKGNGLHVIDGQTIDLLVLDYGGAAVYGDLTAAEQQLRVACEWTENHPGKVLVIWTTFTAKIYELELAAEFGHLGNVLFKYHADHSYDDGFYNALTQWYKLDLAPCPFCGGSVEYQHFDISGEHHFTCTDCGTVTMFDVDLSPALAVERWNARLAEAKSPAQPQAATDVANYYIVSEDRTRADDFVVFWRRDGQGYTRNLHDAGIFSENDIANHRRNPELLFIPVEAIVITTSTITAVPSHLLPK